MLVLSSDPHDDEATASVAILADKIQASASEDIINAGICILANCNDMDATDLFEVLATARALLVILTRASLESAQQLHVIRRWKQISEHSEFATVEVIPVSTPGFIFPGEALYSDDIPVRGDVVLQWRSGPSRHALQSLFKKIAANLSTNASDYILNAQAHEICARIPRSQGPRQCELSIYQL